MSAKPLPGFRDFYPQEFAERAYIFRVWREVAARYGFVEYDGPPLEPLDLYTRKSGDEIVGQLYNFVDKGGRDVSLRPEMTPTFARLVGAKANALRKPVRWFSIPQLFRYERQQRGRLREHFQLNVDLVGEADVAADAELLAVAVDILRAFGLGAADVRARVSDRRLLAALLLRVGLTDDQLPAAYAAVDKVEREPREALVARLAGRGVAAEVAERALALARVTTVDALRAEHGGDPAVAEALDRFARYVDYCGALGVGEWLSLDLSIVRGLAYYTGIVFELFDARGEFRAICGGGRYDALLGALGGADLPALGFGMGDVVLGELLRDRKLMPGQEPSLDYWVEVDPAAGDGERRAMAIATRLRAHGARVEYPLRAQAVGKQKRAAFHAGARRIVRALPADGSGDEYEIEVLADGARTRVRGDGWMAERDADGHDTPN
ncbi:histidine--tRNA ligase [Gemmatimonadetes bacterium T265]|nr:histidine--tRNA ligase [Gemmatimonadetes bacterium T265]